MANLCSNILTITGTKGTINKLEDIFPVEYGEDVYSIDAIHKRKGPGNSFQLIVDYTTKRASDVDFLTILQNSYPECGVYNIAFEPGCHFIEERENGILRAYEDFTYHPETDDTEDYYTTESPVIRDILQNFHETHLVDQYGLTENERLDLYPLFESDNEGKYTNDPDLFDERLADYMSKQ